MPVIIGAEQYPENILGKIEKKGVSMISVDATKLALEAGNVKAVNVALIGVLASKMNIDKQVWLDVIKETVPEKFYEVNVSAFELGYNCK